MGQNRADFSKIESRENLKSRKKVFPIFLSTFCCIGAMGLKFGQNGVHYWGNQTLGEIFRRFFKMVKNGHFSGVRLCKNSQNDCKSTCIAHFKLSMTANLFLCQFLYVICLIDEIFNL